MLLRVDAPTNVVAAAHVEDLLMQAKAEVDRMAQLQMDRSSLAFGSAMVCSFAARCVCDSAMWLRTDASHTHVSGQGDTAQDVRMRHVHAIEPRVACAGGHQPVGRRVRGAAVGAAA
jgi:hypothetical protein